MRAIYFMLRSLSRSSGMVANNLFTQLIGHPHEGLDAVAVLGSKWAGFGFGNLLLKQNELSLRVC
jgi:hypothetical protein